MGLRSEQFDIDELLKYFVSRDEFSRAGLVDVLKNLTADELYKMDIMSSESVNEFYEQIQNLITQILVDYNSIDKNKEIETSITYSLSATSFYEDDFLLRKASELVLKSRNKYTSDYLDIDMLFEKITESNPLVVSRVISENGNLKKLNEIEKDFTYTNKDVLKKLAYFELLDLRDVDFTFDDDLSVLQKKVTKSNPYIISITEDNHPYLKPDCFYDTEWLKLYGKKVFCAYNELEFDEETTEYVINSMYETFLPKIYNTDEINTLPINSKYYYEEEFLEKYGFVKLLERRGYGDTYTFDSTIEELEKAVNDSNPSRVSNNYLTIEEISEALNYDKYFFKSLEHRLNEMATALSSTEYVDKQDIYYYDLLYKEIEGILNDFINGVYSDFYKWTTDRLTYALEQIALLGEDIIDDRFGVKTGSSQFLGGSTKLTITHNLGKTPDIILILPKENSEGSLGEYWANGDSTNIYVYNSGSSTVKFNWVAMYCKQKDGVAYGKTSFATGNSIAKIEHKLGKKPDFVNVLPCEDANGDLGEVYYTFDKTYIYVYNSGDTTTRFSWFAFNKLEGDHTLFVTRNFKGNSSKVSIKHGFSSEPFLISVSPVIPSDITSSTNTVDCQMGEVFIDVDENYIYVTNTGSYTGQFNLISIVPATMEKLEKYVKYEPTGKHNVEGYFDKGIHEVPTGKKRINYSGYLATTGIYTTNTGYCHMFKIPSTESTADYEEGTPVFLYTGSASEDSLEPTVTRVYNSTYANKFMGIVTKNPGVTDGNVLDTSAEYVTVCISGIIKANLTTSGTSALIKAGEYLTISTNASDRGLYGSKVYLNSGSSATTTSSAVNTAGYALAASPAGTNEVILMLGNKL